MGFSHFVGSGASISFCKPASSTALSMKKSASKTKSLKGMANITQKAVPMDDHISRIGDQVQAQQTLGLIVPSNSQGLMVQLWVPSRSLALLSLAKA